MAEVFLARHPHGSMDIMASQDRSPRPTQLAAPTEGTAQPDSTSPLVFPGFQDPATMQDTYQRQQEKIESSAAVRRPGSRSRPKNLSINALPAFEFGAGAMSSDSTRGPSPSPTRSPARRTPLHHMSGHRRGVSEFVGGDVSNPITAGLSPTSGEEMPSLLVKTSGPPTSRRGHAHRRSGALSQNDLSVILKPSNDNRAGSAPTTPCDLSSEFPHASYLETDRSLSQPASTTFSKDRASSPPRQADGQPRAHVTFNNDPEFIPRPLSTISSDTSSSMSTVRANHSMNDSITSIVSANTSSPASLRTARIGSGPTEHGVSRHRTRSSGSIPNNLQSDQLLKNSPNLKSDRRPSSAPMDGSTGNQMDSRIFASVHHFENASQLQTGAIVFNRSGHSSDSISNSNPTKPPYNPEARKQRNSTPSFPVARPRTAPEPKLVKRQKKVKSWAGSILSRKAKQQMANAELKEEDTSELPPPPNASSDPSHEGNFSLDDVTFDEDTTCIIERPHAPRENLSGNTTHYPVFNVHGTSPSMEYENPMLDIDAALASLDRPGSSSDVNLGFSSTKRRMHSSGETGGFSGPGMHYHRRAESAPELDLFDYNRLGFAHRGSNPAMAEAIEEEEEEEGGEKEGGAEECDEGKNTLGSRSHIPEQEAGLGVSIIESEHALHEPMRRRMRRNEDARNESISPKSHPPAPQHVWGGVEIVGADEEPRSSVITKSSDESTITPTLSPEPYPPTSTPLNVATHTPMLTGVNETASAVSSPDFGKTSFDNHDPPRIHTATSSITDRATLSSSRTGEVGPGSVDDVPSLTSSASTMISGHPTRFSSSANTTASLADRSSSLSAAVPARTSVRPGSSKRSSLASLSRLVGSSYNKSKLNIAELAPPDSPEKPEKKRSKRMSRLMFWKSKEKLSP